MFEYATQLPEGVRLLTEEESKAQPNPHELPVLDAIYHHGFDRMRDGLEQAYCDGRELLAHDFSCGKAMQVIVGGQVRYTPADYDQRLSDYLSDWVDKHPDVQANENGQSDDAPAVP